MVQIDWIGHGTFQIEANGHRVLIDPFITGNPVATQRADDPNPETIVVSHAYGDHVGEVVEIARRSGATVLATAARAGCFADREVEKTVGFSFGGTVEFYQPRASREL